MRERVHTDLLISLRKNLLSFSLGICVLAGLLFLVWAIIKSKLINLEIIFHYLFSKEIIIGATNALLLGTLALMISAALGLFIAIARLSQNLILSYLGRGYIYFFRSVPMLIQIIFWFNAFPIMFPQISLQVPFSNTLFEIKTIEIITPFLAALIGISLAESAYMAEIFRGGINAINKGQTDAAKALGMSKHQIILKIIMPQVCRIVLPSTGNEFITLIKGTSLAMTIGYLEILRVVTNTYSVTFEVIELLCVAAIWYLFLAALVSLLQRYLEKRFPSNLW